MRQILHKDLGMVPHKVQLVQELKPIDHRMHFHFAKWACARHTEDADFDKKKKKIIFSNEVHFDLRGYQVQVQVQVEMVALMSSSKAHLSAHTGPL